MKFDTPHIENLAEAEQHLRHQLLRYGGVPGIVEQNYEISRFLATGWKRYEGNQLYISFTKTTPETRLIAEVLLFQCLDNPNYLDFQSFARAPGLVLTFPESCMPHINQVERTIMGGIETFMSGNPRREGWDIFKRYRIKTKKSNLAQRTDQVSQR